MEPGKVWIIGPESNGVVLVELFAEQIEAVACHGHIMRREREQQPLWSCGVRIGIQDELQQLGKRKSELASFVGDEAQE